MRCYICGHSDTKVIDSRPSEDGSSIRRRRECLSCGKRFTTYECVEIQQIYVIKSDGRRELFDREKLRRGLMKSCEKCPVSIADIEAILDNVTKKVSNGFEQEVETKRIGEFVMDELKEVNEVAYVRFASVYREFKDISSFMDELKQMIKEKE